MLFKFRERFKFFLMLVFTELDIVNYLYFRNSVNECLNVRYVLLATQAEHTVTRKRTNIFIS